ncbi:MAG: hypothetical protein R3D67_21155 [Hyphomicrobiaceae bacterium]
MASIGQQINSMIRPMTSKAFPSCSGLARRGEKEHDHGQPQGDDNEKGDGDARQGANDVA